MSRLELTLAATPVGALDLSPLTPAALAGKSLDRIRRLRLREATRSRALGDLFEVAGDTGGDTLALHRLTAGCVRVGQGLRAGLIEVSGQPGVELGREMRGGTIRVRGTAGDGVGLGMRGGRIHIHGDAGERVGGAVPGATHGMNRGSIVITGSVGARAGERMRRGLIVVGGDCGVYLGDRMVAGTIAVFGACGDHVGLGMRRGTVLLARAPQRMPATFNSSGRFELAFVAVLARHVAGIDARFGRRINSFAVAERWCGDLAHGGRGEILIARAEPLRR